MREQDNAKQQWRDKCAQKHSELVAATSRVPAAVLRGSIQTAKAWKALAKSVMDEKHKGGKSGDEIDELQALYRNKCVQLDQLRGERPL